MFSQSRNLAIMGGTFVDIRGEPEFEKLERACAPNAFHNSSARCDYDRPKCHPNTRVAILEYLMGWIFGRNDPEALILWLYGPAGAGKSAILQTIAERCFEHNILLASFFFSRSDPSRNHFKPLVATIACQIAVTIPELKPYIENVIQRDSHIFDKSIATQIQSLVIEPLAHLVASGFFNDLSTCARLILIDALDECNDPRMQSEILKAIARALRGHKIPLIFLISSRPEQMITHTFDTFESSLPTGLWRSLVLDDAFKPDEDIRLYLNDSFQQIKASHPLRRYIPKVWPVQSDIDELVQKASGQFIFASVVIGRVSAHDNPSKQLEDFISLRPARSKLPFAELDALYDHILASCKEDPERVHRILELFIIGIVHVSKIEMLLDLEVGSVESSLAPLQSILTVRPKYFNEFEMGIDEMDMEIDEMEIYLFHASFADFLVDSSRSTRFYINKLTVKEHTLSICMRKLMHPPSFTSNSPLLQLPLCMLAESLRSSLRDLPWSETVESALKGFSLPDMWAAWSAESDIERMFPHLFWGRLDVVDTFLDGLYCLTEANIPPCHRSWLLPAEGFDLMLFWPSYITLPENLRRFAEIYAFHISSFEPVLKSELRKYYHNEVLTSLVVLLTTSFSRPTFISAPNRIFYSPDYILRDTVKKIMQITEESDTLGLEISNLLYHRDHSLLSVHYYYLFTGTNESARVGLDGDKYARTALRVLRFLCPPCTRPPHHFPYGHHPTPNRYGVSTQSPLFSLYTTTHERRTHLRILRKLRVKKYRYGVTLSLPRTETTDEYGEPVIPSEFGLRVLPEILERSSQSPELVNFIRMHGKDIAFLPKWTRKAIRAMHEYLDRPYEDLVNKFASMVIIEES